MLAELISWLADRLDLGGAAWIGELFFWFLSASGRR